jgi:hypothetical protein
MSAITAIQPLPPPIPIPDWRRVERVHPKSFQIGVDFRDSPQFGADFSGFPPWPFVPFVVKRFGFG